MRDVSLLIQALPYIRKFRDRRFVVKLGGELLREPELLDAIASDLTLVHMVGIKICVVHGGGPQANALSEMLGFKPTLVNGRRVTDARALEVAKMVFAGKVRSELLSAISRHGGRGVGVSGIDAQLIRARKRPRTRVEDEDGARDVDFGFVGDIVEVDVRVLEDLIANGYLPVVSSLAADEDGTILNVNADTIAAELAIRLGAEKLINMTSAPGVLRGFGTKSPELISVLTVTEARALLQDGTAGKGMRPKLENLARAVEGGVGEAHVINGLDPHSLLLEIFTDQGIGTMLLPDPLPPEAGDEAAAQAGEAAS